MSGEIKALIVLMGLPSSGKSTIAKLLAKELSNNHGFNSIVIGTDTIRELIPSQIEQFDPAKEPFIKDLTFNAIQYCLINNYIVINDDMNYYKSMRHEFKELAEQNSAHLILIHLQIPLETALAWNKSRGLPIPQEVIKRVHDRFDKTGEYQWDTPLLTIQSDKISPDSAIRKIIADILPILAAPIQSKISLPTKPGINEEIDKITRNVVATFAVKEKDPHLLKKISSFRIEYIKNIQNKELGLENLEQDFSQKLSAFISQIKQAK